MIAVITPEGSVVFSSPEYSVHVDARRRTVEIEERSGPETGAISIRESHFVDEVGFERSADGGGHVYLSLSRPGGESFSLGAVPRGAIARQLVQALEAISGAEVREVQRARTYHEQETRRLDYQRSPLRMPSVPIDDLVDELELDIQVVIDEDAAPEVAGRLDDDEPDPTVPIRLRPRAASTP